ncbi:MAG TPA: hypothetical protein DCS15_05400 [Flavobacteriales bacterium]|nr:hypothetical protein [Flavobacteriales bacterium]
MSEEKNTELQAEDFYKSPEGYLIFTEHYLLKRGYCCQNGCKHCPYGFDPKTGTFRKDAKTDIQRGDTTGNTGDSSRTEKP